MGTHSLLSPSSAHRWMQCPASAKLAEQYPREDSPASLEGTAAHDLVEIHLKFLFGEITQKAKTRRVNKWEKDHPEYDFEEANDHALAFVEHIEDRQENGGFFLSGFVEIPVNPGIPHTKGRADAILLFEDHVEIWDYKYGAGKFVSAVSNPQIMLYGLGAAEHVASDPLAEVEWVRCGIFQPRAGGDPVRWEDWTLADLRTWREETVRPAADLALSDDPPFNPEEDACRWCPAAGDCTARARAAVDEAFPTLLDDDADPAPQVAPEDVATLSPEQVARVLTAADTLGAWVKDVQEAALRRAHDGGETLPGWRVVASKTQRRITDAQEAAQRLTAAGVPSEVVWRSSLATLGTLDKAAAKAGTTLADALGDVLGETDARPVLAPADDPRPDYADAATEAFDDLDDDDLL